MRVYQLSFTKWSEFLLLIQLSDACEDTVELKPSLTARGFGAMVGRTDKFARLEGSLPAPLETSLWANFTPCPALLGKRVDGETPHPSQLVWDGWLYFLSRVPLGFRPLWRAEIRWGSSTSTPNSIFWATILSKLAFKTRLQACIGGAASSKLHLFLARRKERLRGRQAE